MKTNDIVLIGILAALLKVSQAALSFLPNIEVVSLLILIFSIRLGVKRTIYITTVFSILNMLLWGVNPASIGYFGTWAIFALICSALKNFIKNEIRAAIVLGIYGFAFGLLFALGYLPFDKSYVMVFWLNGITFDIVHGISNFLIGIWIFNPVLKGFDRACNSIYKRNYNQSA